MASIYLAGPEVFLPNALEIGAKKKRICEAYGLMGLFPLDKEIQIKGASPERVGTAIYAANITLMEQADGIIANMTPFRGPSMDVGTAFEVGFCVGRSIPIFGYTNVAAKLVDRVGSVGKRRGTPLDKDGLDIEDFGFHENLMIEVAVRHASKVIAANVDREKLFTDLRSFEQAVRLAAERLLEQPLTNKLHA